MAGFRRLVPGLVAWIRARVDSEPDPAALTGRWGSRRHGLPVTLRGPDPLPERVGEPEPDQAQTALDRIRADQHRRMRRGPFGR